MCLLLPYNSNILQYVPVPYTNTDAHLNVRVINRQLETACEATTNYQSTFSKFNVRATHAGKLSDSFCGILHL